MPLIICEVTLDLNWSENCVICEAGRVTTFPMTSVKPYVPVVTLSTQDNAKLLQQLKSRFKRTINWNKYQSKASNKNQDRYFDCFISPSFEGVNRLFVLSFENENGRPGSTGYYLPKVEIKYYNVKIDGRNVFDQPADDNIKTFRKIATGQGDDYTTGSLLDYLYFKENHKLIGIDLSKQETLDTDPRAIQQINFTANLDQAAGATMIFITEEAKETVLDFSQGTVKVL